MKTTLVIVSVLLVVGLVAGIVVPPDAGGETTLVEAAEQPARETPPNRALTSRGQDATVPVVDGGASGSSTSATSEPPLTPHLTAERGDAVPLADALGIAGLLGGAIATVLLLQHGSARRPARPARDGVPRHQP